MPAPKGPKRTAEEIDFIVSLGYDHTAHEIADLFNQRFKSSPLTDMSARYLRGRYSKEKKEDHPVDNDENADQLGLNNQHGDSIQQAVPDDQAIQQPEVAEDSAQLDPHLLVHDIHADWHIGAHGGCPLNGQHQHTAEGGIRVPSLATVHDMRRLNRITLAPPPDAAFIALMDEMEEVVRKTDQGNQKRREAQHGH